MKFFETHFDEYIKSGESEPFNNVHIESSNKSITSMNNLIIYGPSGIGKYTHTLKILKNYSPSDLKYEKKLTLSYNKSLYYFKISDIHYEIDMSLLGCNSKLLWHEIYNQITDIIAAKSEKTGIILCKYFNEIHNELLEIFYSYMQKQYNSGITIKFILITHDLSFIPDNILSCCRKIKLPRLSRSTYNKNLKIKLDKDINISQITNIKDIKNFKYEQFDSAHSSANKLDKRTGINQPHKVICDNIIEMILNTNNLKFLQLRELLYDICIFDLNIINCIWYILDVLINKTQISDKQLNLILIESYSFFKLYNNNYRPIYHLERYVLYIAAVIHGLL
jgi:DNA polymerase III delta prime subunit